MKTQEIDSLRACFPALDRTRNQRPVAYFDGPGGTQVPRCVVEAMSEYLCCHNANTHSAYAASIETDEIILSARHSFADFFNAAPEEVAFGANMTTLTYHVARALGRRLNRGDEVVITELDHHGNVGPWEALAIERGVGLRVVKMLPETGQLDWDDFEGKPVPHLPPGCSRRAGGKRPWGVRERAGADPDPKCPPRQGRRARRGGLLPTMAHSAVKSSARRG